MTCTHSGHSLVFSALALVAVLSAPRITTAAGAGGARPGTVVVQEGNQAIRPASPAAPATPAAGAQKLQAAEDANSRAAAAGGQANAAPAPGAPATEPLTGLPKSQAIMAKWKAKHPDRAWEDSPAHTAKLSPVPGDEQKQTYGAFTERDEALWEASFQQVVKRGKDPMQTDPTAIRRSKRGPPVI